MKLITKLFFCLFLFSLSFFAKAQTGGWTLKSPLPASGRYWAAGFSIGNYGYLGLGTTGIGSLNDFWKYDPINNSWTQMVNFPGAAARYATGFELQNKGYVYTYDTNPSTVSEFWEYNPNTNNWIQKANFPGANRADAVAFSISNRGYFGMGGQKLNPPFTTYYSDIWAYDALFNSWNLATNFPPGARTKMGCSVIGNKVYLSCGQNTQTPKFNDVWTWNALSNSWTQLPDLPTTKRVEPISFALNGNLYVGLGDTIYGCCYDFWKYSPNTNLWVQQCHLWNYYRIKTTCFSILDKGYFFCGITAVFGQIPGIAIDDVYEFDPNGIPTSISSLAKEEVLIYPNPINDIITIQLKKEITTECEVKIYSAAGQLVYESDYQVQNKFITINNLDIPSGVYFISLQIGNDRLLSKLIKQ